MISTEMAIQEKYVLRKESICQKSKVTHLSIRWKGGVVHAKVRRGGSQVEVVRWCWGGGR